MTQGNTNLARQDTIDDFLHIHITETLIQNVHQRRCGDHDRLDKRLRQRHFATGFSQQNKINRR